MVQPVNANANQVVQNPDQFNGWNREETKQACKVAGATIATVGAVIAKPVLDTVVSAHLSGVPAIAIDPVINVVVDKTKETYTNVYNRQVDNAYANENSWGTRFVNWLHRIFG